jgi:SAM-dependent methyltransferase
LDLDAVNRSRYEAGGLPREYARSAGLQRPEQVVLERIADDVRGAPILDIGVGGGRTTPFLRALSDDYLGVDYSAAMIATCRERHPDARFDVLDARALHHLPSKHYGLVLFSFNGIDCIAHQERLDVLREIRRIVRHRGWFVFSSHNRDAPVTGFRPPTLYRTRHPVRMATRVGAWTASVARAFANRRRLRPFECETADYAIRNDQAHEYSLLTYYVRMPDQFAQLRAAGFTATPSAYALDGRPLAPGETARDAWIYYAVQA